jgi:hypothetical protein
MGRIAKQIIVPLSIVLGKSSFCEFSIGTIRNRCLRAAASEARIPEGFAYRNRTELIIPQEREICETWKMNTNQLSMFPGQRANLESCSRLERIEECALVHLLGQAPKGWLAARKPRSRMAAKCAFWGSGLKSILIPSFVVVLGR